MLYYASRGINAYPLSKDPSSVQAMDSRSAGQTTSANSIGELVPDDTRPDSKIVGGSANPMPGTAAPTDKETTGTPPDETDATKAPEDGSAVYYIIYESSTGKVLKDNVANDELESALEEHRFGDTASRNALIMAVLSRDVESDIVLTPD